MENPSKQLCCIVNDNYYHFCRVCPDAEVRDGLCKDHATDPICKGCDTVLSDMKCGIYERGGCTKAHPHCEDIERKFGVTNE